MPGSRRTTRHSENQGKEENKDGAGEEMKEWKVGVSTIKAAKVSDHRNEIVNRIPDHISIFNLQVVHIRAEWGDIETLKRKSDFIVEFGIEKIIEAEAFDLEAEDLGEVIQGQGLGGLVPSLREECMYKEKKILR